MRPIRIELYANKENDLHMTVLGVGDAGEKAVKKTPFVSDGDTFGYFSTLTFCSDSIIRNPNRLFCDFDDPVSIRAEFDEIIKETDWLFIVADISNEEDLKHALYYAELHKDIARCPFDTLVEIGNPVAERFGASEMFDLTISVERGDEAYKPIDMLISGIPAGDIGLDFADIMYVAKKSPVMKFAQEKIPKVDQLEQVMVSLQRQLAETGSNDEIKNMMVLYNAPAYCPLEDIEYMDEYLNGLANGGDIIWQIKFHDEADDRFAVSLLYGVQEKGKDDKLPKWKVLEFSDLE